MGSSARTPYRAADLRSPGRHINAKATGYFDGMLLAGCIRIDAGDIIAGFNGHTWGGCCELSHVWVDERYRGQGLGAVLLRSAEAEAVARGRAQVVLATHSFQAPGFYERMSCRSTGASRRAEAAIGFVDVGGDDYRLSASSIYRGTGTDGKDPG